MKFLFYSLLFFSVFLSAEEEIVVTGSYIKNTDNELSPIETFSRDDYLKFNTMSLSEISRYVPSISGSHFQTNSMDGEDQGMSAITLRGLDHASTLLMINTKSCLITKNGKNLILKTLNIDHVLLVQTNLVWNY